MLGQDLTLALANSNVTPFTKEECDITDIDQVEHSIRDADLVVNCAAYTAVDEAESNKELAFKINAEGPKNIAQVCQINGSKLIHISTDYVFSGDAEQPYTEVSIPDPKTVYGASKLSGEVEVQRYLPNNHIIIRTAWLYGKHGRHFGKTILERAKSTEILNVVDDQIGQPTWSLDLAKKIIELGNQNSSRGIYHGTSQGSVSWFEFAKNIFQLNGLDPDRIKPVKSSEFVRATPRPKYSVLAHSAFQNQNLEPIGHWDARLKAAFAAGVFDV